MALELIDGYAGTPHIDGADLAALNQGCFGAGDYVFDYGDDLKATMTTANQVTIGTGALVSKGRRAVNLSAQSLTVQSGTQGQKRNDIVVARYSKASGDPIEAMKLAVVKGTPVSYGEAADPSVTSNDMKLWRIPINGITPGTPVQLFETIPSIDSLRDSVSQQSGNFVFTRCGGVVIAYTNGNRMSCAAWGSIKVADIPEGYRPSRQEVGFATFANGGNCFLVAEGSSITLRNLETASDNMQYYGQVVYPVA